LSYAVRLINGLLGENSYIQSSEAVCNMNAFHYSYGNLSDLCSVISRQFIRNVCLCGW